MLQSVGAELLFLYDVGSGEMIKASLLQKVHCIDIVRNNAHKAFVMGELKAFVKERGLVNLTSYAPKRPPELIRFEQKHD